MNGRTDFFCQRFCFLGILISRRDKAYCGMPCRQLRAQAADTAGTDDGQTQRLAFDVVLPGTGLSK